MGIGPGSLTEGDQVFVLLGSRVPLILRRTPKTSLCHNGEVETLVSTKHETEEKTRCFGNHQTFELLDDAYVHGIMDYQIGAWKDRFPETVFLT